MASDTREVRNNFPLSVESQSDGSCSTDRGRRGQESVMITLEMLLSRLHTGVPKVVTLLLLQLPSYQAQFMKRTRLAQLTALSLSCVATARLLDLKQL